MKLPKTVSIGGLSFRVVKDSSFHGASFNCCRQIICVGTKDASADVVWRRFVHEVLEAIIVDKFLRLEPNQTEVHNGDYMFVFNHDQYQVVVAELAGILRPMLRE